MPPRICSGVSVLQQAARTRVRMALGPAKRPGSTTRSPCPARHFAIIARAFRTAETRSSVLVLAAASVTAVSCHGAQRTTSGQSASVRSQSPAMVANWDPSKRMFVPLPSGSALRAPQTTQASATSAATAPVLQALPSGKGTFIDLHGTSQSYVVIKASSDGGISTTCLDGPGTH